ncbi:helix-turn-helix transcriptional regulator [Billgrantia endophytica]|nr:LuxR family transcriptional regulator [Halomonas endophytica]
MLNIVEDRIKEIASKDEFESCIEDMLFSCGVERYSYVYFPISPSQASDVYIFGNYDINWVDIYKKERFYRKDPVIIESSRTSLPFYWSKLSGETEKDSNIFDLAHDYGIEKGYSIPIHDPGSGFGSIHVAAELNDAKFESRIKDNLYALRLLSIMAHHYLSLDGMMSCSICFSGREEECLYWVSQGKTYGEAAIIMGITERTVKFHMNSMAKKLNVVNAKQLIAKSMSMNLIPARVK